VNERQRLENLKGCAVQNPNYLLAQGRCSKVCTVDTVDGFKIQKAGGACAAGFTRQDHYLRTEFTGCASTDCPSYAPLNRACPEYAATTQGRGMDFSIRDHQMPDRADIWGASFVSPHSPRWAQKLNEQYLPTVLGTGTQYVEDRVLAHHASGYKVCRLAHYPVDDSQTLIVKKKGTGTVYERHSHYLLDEKTGAIRMRASTGLVAGDQLEVTYTRKGLGCDGVFCDRADVTLVYPEEGFGTAFANLIKSLAVLWPTAAFAVNEGFDVLPQMISALRFVMVEGFATRYDPIEREYDEITDPAELDRIAGYRTLLRTLRSENKFDVLALDYAPDGASGEALRQVVFERHLAAGYLSWCASDGLENPAVNDPRTTESGAIRGNVFSAFRTRSV
jgi:hypothetical protein